ncbi:MAG: AAA family ATPase [Legionellales bacterium]|jgi:hypothetical protein
MKRTIFQTLREWRTSVGRKPVILRGARQVGKTHVVKSLGQEFEHFVEINFERSPKFCELFSQDLDPVRIIEAISLSVDKLIIPGKTLLFFDEIQACPQAIIALRYFYEEMPDLHVIAAGSLLDFAIEKVGVPVGRISFLYMYPMSFIEFLVATGHQLIAKEIIHHKVQQPLNEVIHTRY